MGVPLRGGDRQARSPLLAIRKLASSQIDDAYERAAGCEPPAKPLK